MVKGLAKSIDDNENMKVYRFCRVLFGAAPSPFLLGATINHHLDRHSDDEIARDIKDNIYVDNLLSGMEFASLRRIRTKPQTIPGFSSDAAQARNSPTSYTDTILGHVN